MADTSASWKPGLTDIRCFKDCKKLTCMLSVSNFRTLEITESRCQIIPRCISLQSNSTFEVKYFVPETYRVRFLANQCELFSQNTWCSIGEQVLIMLQPEWIQDKEQKKTNLFKCFQSWVPLKTYPLPLRWLPSEVGVKRMAHGRHLSTAYHTKRNVLQCILKCSQETKHLE